MKVVSVIGARPQFIKEAIVQKALKNLGVEEVLIHTGQHYDSQMSGVFFEQLDMSMPQYHLGIHNKTHGAMTGEMIIEIEKVLIKEKPDKIILYGDTNSTLAGAIAASKLDIPIAHIEAGLRQEPKNMPEEINRVIVDRVSKYLFCPTQLAVENLHKEGKVDHVEFVGDVMYDLFLLMKDRFNYETINQLGLESNEYIMMTLHRDFNVDCKETLRAILEQVSHISKEIRVVWPIHPRSGQRIKEFGLQKYTDNIQMIEPLSYLELMGLTSGCQSIITDSGGYQKEAYFAGKQACVLMPDTSWRELVECGWNKLSTPDSLCKDLLEYRKLEKAWGLYGSGNAAEKIVHRLIRG